MHLSIKALTNNLGEEPTWPNLTYIQYLHRTWGEVQTAALRNVPPSNRGLGFVHLPSTVHPDIGRKIPVHTGFTKHIHYEPLLSTHANGEVGITRVSTPVVL